MILGFSTQLNGKPTYFVEKIHSALLQNDLLQGFDLGYNHEFDLDKLSSCQPKLHTIREDKNDRWQPGTKIDFFINCRQKDMFRFAPVLPVVSVQKVTMSYAFSDIIEIYVDGRRLHGIEELMQFAENDGFDMWKDFFDYFYPKIMISENKEYHVKLIHWTDLKY